VAEAVLDASALLAFLRREPGAEKVAAVLTHSCISAVNLAETYGKMVEYGNYLEEVAFQIERLRIAVVPFDDGHARIAASFWKHTRSVGMSLGDRACLALALQTGLPALTTEGEWLKCDTGVQVVKIR
jgi:PIN domain nuclease of toxin-antitoxin system